MLDARTVILCALNLMPRVIVAPGRYVTRRGETVTVDFVSSSFPPPVFSAEGSYGDGIAEMWHVSGRVLPFTESRNDIVARLP